MMLPVVEPLAGFSAPITLGLVWLGAFALAGMIALVALVVAGRHPPRPRATVTPLQRRLARAA